MVDAPVYSNYINNYYLGAERSDLHFFGIIFIQHNILLPTFITRNKFFRN